jgi:hypothetical protein
VVVEAERWVVSGRGPATVGREREREGKEREREPSAIKNIDITLILQKS